MAFLLGPDRAELKQRMERIITAEEETVKTMKKQIDTMLKLIDAIGQHKQVMEKLCAKL